MLMSLPLLPAAAINKGLEDIFTQCVPLITTTTAHASVRQGCICQISTSGVELLWRKGTVIIRRECQSWLGKAPE